jgi:hypothetical protein
MVSRVGYQHDRWKDSLLRLCLIKNRRLFLYLCSRRTIMSKTVATQAAANMIPSFLQEFQGAKETAHMDASDFATPSLRLIQPTTQDNDDPANIGKFVDSLTGEVLPSINVYNLHYEKFYRVKIAKAEGEDDELVGNYATRDEADDKAIEVGGVVEEQHKHYVAAADDNGAGLSVYVMYFGSKSAVRASREWNTQIVLQNGNVPRQAIVWSVGTERIKGKQGSWYVPKATKVGTVPDRETMVQLIELAKSFNGTAAQPVH